MPTPGARVWTAPSEAAHQAALRTSLRSLGLGEPARPARAPAPPWRPPPRSAARRSSCRWWPATASSACSPSASPRTSTSARRSWNSPRTSPAGPPSPSTTPACTRSAPPSASPSSAACCRPELPEIPGVEVEVIYRAAGEGNEVGGDFYDLFPIRDGAYGFAIGDVCGTGPEAAAVTGLARHALRLLAREGFGGPAVLERLNAAILDEGARSRFLTLLYGELWPQEDGSAVLKVVCAGHPLPLRLRQDGSVEPAAEPQPLLGVMEDLELYEQTVTLDPGDVLLCVTDGVTERREGTRMLGDDGLADVLTTCTGLTAGAVAARVLRAVERFAAEPPSDDMAILAMRVPGPRTPDGPANRSADTTKGPRQLAGAFFAGAPIRNRTVDLLLTMETLCRLSYWGLSRSPAATG